MKKILLTALLGAMALGASAATQDFSWSYVEQPFTIGAFGTAQAETYSVAIKFDQPNYAGMKIVKIDCYINEDASSIPNISGTSVFATTNLESNSFLRLSDVTPEPVKLMGEDLAVLSYDLSDNPISISGSPIYLGYNLKVDRVAGTGERYPVLVDKDLIGDPNTCYVRTPYLTDNLWEEKGSLYGAAVIYITIQREVSEYYLGVGLPEFVYVAAGEQGNALVTLANSGLQTVNNVDYEYSINNGDPISGYLEFENPLAPSIDASYTHLFPINAMETPGEYIFDFAITKVNGVPNEAGDAGKATGELDVLPYIPQHMPLVEEYTALNCGYCPRGYAAMEYVSEEYSDDANVICYHLEFQNRQEPMAVVGSAPINATNYPTASIDRLSVIDPYYGDYQTYGMRDLGIIEDIFRRADEASIVDINIKEVTVSLPDSVLNVTTDVTFMKNVTNDQYRIGYVLTCDGLYSPNWAQTNALTRDPSIKDAPLLDKFYSLPGTVYGLTFNDVAIIAKDYRGIASSLTDITIYEPTTLSYSFDVRDVLNIYKQSLNPYIQIDQMKVIAFVIQKSNGRVINSTRFNVGQVYDAIETVGGVDEQVVSTVYYDLNGCRVANPDKGIYVKSETLSDGTVRTSKIVK